MIDSGITSHRCNHIWLCNRSLDGDTLQLRNGGCPSDVAQYILALVEGTADTLFRSLLPCWCVTLEMFTSVYLCTSQRYQKLLGSGLAGNQTNEFLWTNIYEDFWVKICLCLVPECSCYLSQSPRSCNNTVGMLLSHFSASVGS